MSDAKSLVTFQNNTVISESKLHFEVSSVPKLIFEKLEQNKGKQILIDSSTETIWTAQQLLDAIIALSVKFIEFGIQQHDVVAFFCPNNDVHTIALLAVTSIGAVYAANLSDCPLREMQNTVVQSEAKYVVCSKSNLNTVHELLKVHPVRKVFLVDTENDSTDTFEFVSIKKLIKNSQIITHEQNELFFKTMISINPDDLMQIGFSSGTTGKPKAVSRTHENNLTSLSLSAPGFELVTEQDVVGINSAFCHMSGIAMLINALCNSAQAVILDCNEANAFLTALQHFPITVSFTVPSTVNLFNNLYTEEIFKKLKLRKLLVAGEALSKEVAEEFVSKYKPQYFGQSYGSSEMGFVTMKPMAQAVCNLCSNGVPLSTMQVKICDIQSRISLPTNTIGEICVKGLQVSKGYVNNETANKESYDKDGFFVTGDAGYVDDTGNVFFSSRFKEIIKYDAYQISPSELEFILLEHEAVKEAVVVGIDDEQYGQLPKAFVVLNKAFEGKIIEQQLVDYVAQNVCDYKRLRGGLKITSCFQRTSIGKIDRRALKMSA